MKIVNRRAKFNYKLLEKYEAGIILSGAEVKALKKGSADISQTYAKIVEGEVWLINANIPVVGKKNYNPTRTRKLLLHKKEIISILSKIKAKKLTIVATKVYNRKRLIKVELALAKTKKQFEKKAVLRKRDIEREIEQELKNREN
ncbi:SsrA-binding protein [Candidatus Woesebacteria bacterium RBG_16_34_12]|uniref:SsrA-binding protein n=1 Tax=Candidatus Woesebacteria bacterium RBG_16_34_12 TaxID=1802480 RepID=A0A1F7X6T0_9BACT|nr:MAG: SsrA-binding protein [Candidatus Woesebacteria bacterium RBG_16_34_12]